MNTEQHALSIAIMRRDPGAFARALERVDDVNFTDSVSEPIIFQAAMHGTVDMVRALISRGARLDKHNSVDENVLWAALRANGNEKILAALIEAGANVEHRSRPGLQLLDFARSINPDMACVIEAAIMERKMRSLPSGDSSGRRAPGGL